MPFLTQKDAVSASQGAGRVEPGPYTVGVGAAFQAAR